MDNTYNGWKNRETWNVALWIRNDEGLYGLARESKDYAQFRQLLADMCISPISFQTPDGVAWNDSGLDVKALDEMIIDLHGAKELVK